MNDRIVILPWVGEFGWQIMQHVRYVNAHPSKYKIVCCQHGHECLYPTAAELFTDWDHPIPDASRCNGTNYYDGAARDRFYDKLRPRLAAAYPECEIVSPEYICHWHMSDAPGYKFHPKVCQALPVVDVVIGPRRRDFDDTRNWDHWPELTRILQSFGLSVGVVGREETCIHCQANAFAWQHPDGDTAGSVDLLSRCQVFVGVDSGMAHLAAILDCPTLLLPSPVCNHNQLGPMKRANKSLFWTMRPDAWFDYNEVVREVQCTLNNLNSKIPSTPVVTQTGGTKRYLNVKDDRAFNGTLAKTNRGTICVFRDGNGESLRYIYVDDSLKPITRWRDTGLVRNDDARIIQHSGKLYLTTSYHWQSNGMQARTELREMEVGRDGELITKEIAKFDTIDNWPGYCRRGLEKNWAPFSSDGEYFYVYSLQPHRILQVNLSTGVASLLCSTGFRSCWDNLGELRLSSPPVMMHNGNYLSTFHVRNNGDYSTGFYEFEGKPPYRVLRISKKPELYPEDAGGRAMRTQAGLTIFVTGMQLDETADNVRLCGGDYDEYVVAIDFQLSKVLANLIPVTR
ncbi:glycosyltransferase family 9 protein [Trichococcus shcherbakoviae]|uniref:glycosyltransferase family 9 protein n=1 Tax=Trichococcus shcherbakoviae TaxID=2094020 RepID=UPI002AA819EE|nr:glycosyltransferase family 9 protein [Trichococcus shcherbakoviae]